MNQYTESTHTTLDRWNDEPICPCHGLPTIRRVFRPSSGDPILRHHCADDDLVIGPTTRRDMATREAA